MIDDFHKLEPYALSKGEKSKLLLHAMQELTEWHKRHCEPYQRYLDAIGCNLSEVRTLEDVPFLPIRAFKELRMKSIPDAEVFKVMKSSGTSGQRQSQIYLDRETAVLQQKVLLRLLGNFVGMHRLPMLVIDSDAILKDRRSFTTRGATIMGLEFAARRMVFALDEHMELKEDVLDEFIETYGKGKFIIFGFTFMVWPHFYHALRAAGERLDLSNAVLIHGGGWKKLAADAVTPAAFRAALCEVCGNIDVADYYGMVEQTGCIYLECAEGHLHASTYADVIVRRPFDFSAAAFGERGILEVVSLLPKSYPGHVLLTEDEGVLLGEDDCPCGRRGKYFKVLGRLKQAELRGCSDTYAAAF